MKINRATSLQPACRCRAKQIDIANRNQSGQSFFLYPLTCPAADGKMWGAFKSARNGIYRRNI